MSIENEKFSQKYSRQPFETLHSGSGFASLNTVYTVPYGLTAYFTQIYIYLYDVAKYYIIQLDIYFVYT